MEPRIKWRIIEREVDYFNTIFIPQYKKGLFGSWTSLVQDGSEIHEENYDAAEKDIMMSAGYPRDKYWTVKL